MDLLNFNNYLFDKVLSYLNLNDYKCLSILSKDIQHKLLESKFQSLKAVICADNENEIPYYAKYIGI